MPLTNLGFETAGATPGAASAWTLVVTSSAERLALFGTETPAREQEDFEAEWDANEDYLFAFDVLDIVAPLFDVGVVEGETLEDFEQGWGVNEGYLFEMGSTDVADLDGADAPDDFEDDWNNNAYLFAMGSSVSAFFDASFAPQGFEDFEDGWRGTTAGNDYDFAMGAIDAASFDGSLAPELVEDFEEVRTEIVATVDPATDLFTAGSLHGFGVADRVSFRLPGAGVLPAGLNGSFIYYVLASGLSTTQFRVSVAAGGTQVDVTDAGVGTFYIVHDRTRYWVIPL